MKREKYSIFARLLYSTLLLFLIVGILGAGVLALWAATLKMPDFNSFTERKMAQSTKIYDRTGKILLYGIQNDIKRTIVKFEDISRNVKNATVAIEDAKFYEHIGVRPLATFRAVVIQPLRGKGVQGGSTITQQVIKNTLLTREKKISRKLKEWALALKLERAMSKEEILTLYLNEAPYGGSIYGVEEASQSFFGKTANEISLAESAYLAALPQMPTYYSPYGNNKGELVKRKNLVLNRMAKLGFITEAEEKQARDEEVKFLNRGDQSIKAPHFSIAVRSYLEKKYGKEAVEQGGLKVITTLNYDLQQKAEDLVKKYADGNTEKFSAYNAGLIGIDPKSGQLLVMVGSKDWSGEPLPEGCSPGVDCKFEPKTNITSYGIGRQPGSSIKPFIYAAAFKKGYSPDTVVFDLKTEFNASCTPEHKPKENSGAKEDECYSPGNYDHVFRGPVSLRNALAQSINIPAVKTLYLVGLKSALATIRDMGITTLNDPNRYGLTLVLGGGEVTLLELTAGYGVFANTGQKNKTVSILKVEDSDGNILEEFKSNPIQAIDKNTSLLISDVLSDNKARTPAFGPRSWLYFPDREVAVKTGTTNDYRDAWVVGYTPNFAMGVWVGNNNNAPMEKKVAGFIAAPLWNAFFKEVFSGLPKESFEKPEDPFKQSNEEVAPILKGEWRGGETYQVDTVSGKLATEFTPPELIIKKILTQVHNILFWVNKKNPLGAKPENPQNDYQFELWEKPVRKWVEEKKIKEETLEDIPQEFDDVHKPEYAPQVTIISPSPNTTYKTQNIMAVRLAYKSKFTLQQVDFFLNNTYLGSANNEPFSFSFDPSSAGNVSGRATLKIIAYDEVRNKTEIIVPVIFSDR